MEPSNASTFLPAALCASLLAGACTVHEPIQSPRPPVSLPGHYSAGTTTGTAGGAAGDEARLPMPDRWWRDFDDPALALVVERVLADNLSLRAAWARIDQASAHLGGARAGRLPQIGLSGSAGRTDPGDVGFGVSPGAGAPLAGGAPGGVPAGGIGLSGAGAQNQLSVALSASYEIDLWRRLSSAEAAARLAAGATRDDMEAMAISLAAETAAAWLDVVAAREHREALDDQIVTSDQLIDLLTLQFDEGLIAAVDVYQARQQRAALAAQRATIDAAEVVAGNRLAALLGIPSGKLAPEGLLGDRRDLPVLPALPGTGVPADLLLRRPDIRAMRRRAEAADWQIARAVADRLPRLSLSAQTGVFGGSPGDLVTRPLWSLAANLFGPIFDGGAGKARVAQARATHTEWIATYGQAVINAIIEVENALVLEHNQRRHIAGLTRQLEVGQHAVREARARYREGLIGFLSVLTALDGVHRSQRQLIDARRQLLAYRIALCRALGGTWTHELTRPTTISKNAR